MVNAYTVYIHENKSNGKIYVGITSCDPDTRWKNGLGYSDKLPIGRALRKYGWDGFNHLIISKDLTEEEAKALEKQLIAELQTQNPTYGYNICAGGDGVTGWHPTDETKHKLSEAAKQRVGCLNGNYGHRWTDEMRKMASETKRNHITEETRHKMSQSAKQRTGEHNGFYGKHHTMETKRILSQLRSRPVDMYNKEGKLINTFPSIKKAAEITGINKVGISNCCRGITKSSGGYIWQYTKP